MPASDRVISRRPGVKLTYDDFLLFPDDGLRHELIDGEHYVTPSPNLDHQRISGRLYLAIGNYLQAHPTGEIVYAPFDVVFSRHDVVEPDLLYLSNERASRVVTQTSVQGAPNLIIEILSKSTRRRDRTIKQRLYERSAVDEYWMVDPVTASIRILRQRAGRFAAAADLRADAGDVLTTPLLPEFTVPLAEIFATPRR
ncbi:MAG: hypothetical protein ABS36_16000 [Acidobacteria bacterium SCN 69-37]|nr:MAG: hypothetical protein ABS36_16000 [Acidobacteria bacterium SCN 69-37]